MIWPLGHYKNTNHPTQNTSHRTSNPSY